MDGSEISGRTSGRPRPAANARGILGRSSRPDKPKSPAPTGNRARAEKQPNASTREPSARHVSGRRDGRAGSSAITAPAGRLNYRSPRR